MPNALTAPANPMQGQAQAQPPAPNHVQTVAALRHFAAVGDELNVLAKNPELGKADMRSAVIDGVTKLVGKRIISPTQAVQQMTSFPDKPFDQKAWVAKMLQQTAQAKMAVVMHHAAAYGGQPAYNGPPSNPDNHIQDMAAMMQSHYPGNNNA